MKMRSTGGRKSWKMRNIMEKVIFQENALYYGKSVPSFVQKPMYYGKNSFLKTGV